jgi:hypothetical protein
MPHHSIVTKFRVNKFLIGVLCILSICGLRPPVLAQHTVSHGAGGAVHISAPPIPHISAPTPHATISTPRTAMVSSAGGALGMAGLRPPRRPIRPFPVFVYESPFFWGGPYWGLNSCWWASCGLLWLWTPGYTEGSSPGPINYVSQPYETSESVYGEEGPDLPQLFLKDGTVLNVTDYWLVDDQLHFTMIEEEGGKPVEHAIPFDALDLQRTVDVNTRRGFRFILRNEPFEQYLRDHPEGPPPAVPPPQE